MHRMRLRLLKAANVLLLAVPFTVCWYEYYASRTYSPFHTKGNWVMVGLFLFLYTLFCRLYGGFTISLSRISELIYSQTLALFFTNFVLYVVTVLLAKGLINVLPYLVSIFFQIALSALWAYCAHKLYFSWNEPLRTAVIWDMREGLETLVDSYGLNKRFQIVETAHIQDCLDHPAELLDQTEAVFLCGIHSRDRNIIVKHCLAAGIRVYVIPRVGDVLMSGASSMHLFHLPMLMVERYNPSPEYLILKRTFDIVLSCLALVLLSPLLLIVACLVRGDGGTAFYRQTRLTRDGREFQVLKFRSMRMDAEKDGVARLSSGEKDDRITPVGRVIRACRIDELPQLINILKGEMSFVGPRPERPEIAKEYEKELPEFSLRLQAKAGLTGYAQVYGKYNTSPYDKLLMDLQYIAHPSLAEDLKIIFATVKILFLPESTEGIEEGMRTAMESGNNRK